MIHSPINMRAMMIPVALGALAGSALARPEVAHARTATLDVDGMTGPTLLVRLYDAPHTGAGSYTSDQFVEITITPTLHSEWPIETTTGPRATPASQQGRPDYRVSYFDEMSKGMLLGPDTDTVWKAGFNDGFQWSHLLEPTAYMMREDFPSSCFMSDFIVPSGGWTGFDPNDNGGFSITEGEHYFGFRWFGDDLQTRYGWVKIDFWHTPAQKTGDSSCNYSDPTMYPNDANTRFLAIGWETEPDTPIAVGVEYCPADINFDTRIDFFDVSVFLNAFTSQDDLADIDGNGVWDFFDVSAFIALYIDPCDL